MSSDEPDGLNSCPTVAELMALASFHKVSSGQMEYIFKPAQKQRGVDPRILLTHECHVQITSVDPSEALWASSPANDQQ